MLAIDTLAESEKLQAAGLDPQAAKAVVALVAVNDREAFETLATKDELQSSLAELGTRLDHKIDAVAERLDHKIDAVAERLDHKIEIEVATLRNEIITSQNKIILWIGGLIVAVPGVYIAIGKALHIV